MIVALNDSIVFRKLDDEIIILNISNSCYYGVRKSALEIFEYIADKKKCRFDEIFDYVKNEFDITVSDAELKKDITGLIEELALENIVNIAENQNNPVDSR